MQTYTTTGRIGVFFMSILFGAMSFVPAYAVSLPREVTPVQRVARGSADHSSFSKQTEQTSQRPTSVPGEVLVKFREHTINLRQVSGRNKAQQFANAQQLEKTRDIQRKNISVLRSNRNESVEEIVGRLQHDPTIEYIQPNFIYYPASIDTNDTYRDQMWALENTGQTMNGSIYSGGVVSGIADSDIDGNEAFAYSEGSGVVVAVIDDGVAYNHPDLFVNMWDGSACLDENGNTLGGCVHGYDFAEEDGTPLPTDGSHGTHIAGTIVAEMNNGKGGIGVAPQASIMALKTNFTTAEIVRAIAFAEKNGAKVINASWANSEYDETMKDAIANFSGLFVAAAGNGGLDLVGDNNETTHQYPSDYDLDNIISVTATDQHDGIASFSNFGVSSVDVGAPGVNIFSTVPTIEGVISEPFTSIENSALPIDWVSAGSQNNWGVIDATSWFGSSWGQVLYGDVNNAPYLANADSTLTLPDTDFEVAGESMIDFWSTCDTADDDGDYMALEAGVDGVYQELGQWNEFSSTLSPVFAFHDGTWSYYHFTKSIPSALVSDATSVRFRWHTDEDDDVSVDGCALDDVQIYNVSDGSDEAYMYQQGTSMAAPHVAGVAALLWGYDSSLGTSDVKTAIMGTVDPIDSLDGKVSSGGRVNAHSALLSLVPLSSDATLSSLTENLEQDFHVPFDSGISTYVLYAEHEEDEVTFTFETGDDQATVFLATSENQEDVELESNTVTLSLPVGEFGVFFTVVAEDQEKTKQYAVFLARATDAPANVVAESVEQSITVSWDDVEGAIAYNLYLATESGVDSGNPNTVAGYVAYEDVASQVTIEGLEEQTTYYVVVTAVVGEGADLESDASVEVSVTTDDGDLSMSPTIVSSDPVDDSVDVSVQSSFYLDFSEDLDPNTVHVDNIQVRKYVDLEQDVEVVPVMLTLGSGDFENSRVKIILENNYLEYNTQYYFYVDSGVTDLDGNPIPEGEQWLHADRDDHEFTTQSLPVLSNFGQGFDPDETGGSLPFMVGLSGPAVNDVTFTYHTEHITTNDDDIGVIESGKAVIPAGDTGIQLDVDITDDNVYEGEEAFQLIIDDIVSGDAELGEDVSATGSFSDPEDIPTVSIQEVGSATEGNAGENTSISLLVTLSNPSTLYTTISFVTEDDTALELDNDYTGQDSQVSFLGETEKYIAIPIVGDDTIEQDETFRVVLGAVLLGQATIDDTSDTTMVTIVNDDNDTTAPAGSVEYSATAVTNQDVIATLSLDDLDAIVTNNDGLFTHTFTENGTFTFEFEDTTGNAGTTTAVVSNIDKVAPVIILVGDATMTLTVGDTYTEFGATVNEDVTALAIGGDTVHTSVAGTYVVTYNTRDAAKNNAVEVQRTVIVVSATPTSSSSGGSSGGGGGGGGGSSTPTTFTPSGVTLAFVTGTYNGASATAQFTLTTGASMAQMALSATPDFTASVWQPYSNTFTFSVAGTLPTDITIYMKFVNTNGQTSSIVSKTVTVPASFVPQVLGEKIVACSLDIGKVYKYPEHPGVWLITTDEVDTQSTTCVRRAFKNPAIYDSYGFVRWSDVRVVSKASLEVIPTHTISFIEWGSERDYLHGELIKTPSDPKVYMLLGNTKHAIASEAVFNALGLDWNVILDVVSGVLPSYTTGAEITNITALPDGALFLYAGSPKVYQLENGIQRRITNEQAFYTHGFSWSGVITRFAGVDTYPTGEDIQ